MKNITLLIKISLIIALTFLTGCKKEDIEANNKNAKLVLLKITNQDATTQGSNYKITFTGSLLTEAKVNISSFGFKVMDNKGATLSILPSQQKISGSGTFEVSNFFLSDQNPNILEVFVVTTSGDTLLSNSGYTILDIVNQFTILPLEFYLGTQKLQDGQPITQQITTNNYNFNIVARNNTDTVVHISNYFPSMMFGAFSTLPAPANGFAIPPHASIQLPVFYHGTFDSTETITFANWLYPFNLTISIVHSSVSNFLPLNFDNNNVILVQEAPPSSNKRKVGVYNFGNIAANAGPVSMSIKNDNGIPVNITKVINASGLYFNFSAAFSSLPINVPFAGANYSGNVSGLGLNGDYASTLMFITDNTDTIDIETHIIRTADIQVYDGSTEINMADYTANFIPNFTNTLTFYNSSNTGISVTLNRDPTYFTDAPLNETFTVPAFGSITVNCTTNSNTSFPPAVMSYSFGSETITFSADIQ